MMACLGESRQKPDHFSIYMIAWLACCLLLVPLIMENKLPNLCLFTVKRCYYFYLADDQGDAQNVDRHTPSASSEKYFQISNSNSSRPMVY
jgi:hypothetical protein